MNKETLAMLNDEGEGTGYLKAGVLGFPKSGKSFTCALLAAAVIRHFKLTGPVAMFDTEGGSVYIKHVIKRLTGKELYSKRCRSFDDLMKWANTCVGNVSVAFVDSITHPWRELVDSYLARVKRPQMRFEDWNVVKPIWSKWTHLYLNSPLHMIIAGRAGWEYEYETNDTGKKELIKTGTKMKTETEFGFEPSLLFEMDTEEIAGTMKRSCVVRGDRFSVIDGKKELFESINSNDKYQLENAYERVYEFFKPHFEMLSPGEHATINTDAKTEFQLNDSDDWQAEKKRRTIFCEEIQGELVRHYPGQTAKDKKIKVDLLNRFFGTTSWTKVEGTDSEKLKLGLDNLRSHFFKENPPKVPEPTPEEVPAYSEPYDDFTNDQ